MKILRGLLVVAFATTAVVACSSSSYGGELLTSGLTPTSDGFSFANFGSSSTPEVFDAADIVAMFGESECVDGVIDPCILTPEAAAWARMVNESRSSGHCEGMVVQAATRFRERQEPATAQLANDGEVTHAVMRAFATQFLPEAQRATAEWAQRSLRDIVNELARSFESGDESYSLGLYTATGGHAVLPYQIRSIGNDVFEVSVYDSNWPGSSRVVIFDLGFNTWRFSFSGIDQTKDPCQWTGGPGDVDLTPLSARLDATCPFCADKATTKSSMLLIRSTTKNWTLTTAQGTYSPADAETLDGVIVRPIRSADCSNVVVNPEYLVSADSDEISLNLPDPSSVYVVNDTSVVELVTDTGSQDAISVTPQRVATTGTQVKVTVSSGDLAVQVTEASPTIEITENQLEVIVPDSSGVGETVVTVTPAEPQVSVQGAGAGTPVVAPTTLNQVESQPPQVLEVTSAKPELPSVSDRVAAATTTSTTSLAPTTSQAASSTIASTSVASTTVTSASSGSTSTTRPGGVPLSSTTTTTTLPTATTSTLPLTTTSSSTTTTVRPTLTTTTTTTPPTSTTTTTMTTTTTTTTTTTVPCVSASVSGLLTVNVTQSVSQAVNAAWYPSVEDWIRNRNRLGTMSGSGTSVTLTSPDSTAGAVVVWASNWCGQGYYVGGS